MKTIVVKINKDDLLNDYKSAINEALFSSGIQIKVNIVTRVDLFTADKVEMSIFNSEIADELIFAVVEHFIKDFTTCLDEDSDFYGAIIITITDSE